MTKQIIIEFLYPDILDFNDLKEKKFLPYVKNNRENLPVWYNDTKSFSENSIFDKFKNSSNSTIKTCWGLRRYFNNTITFPMYYDCHFLMTKHNDFILEENLYKKLGLLNIQIHPIEQMKKFVSLLDQRKYSHFIKFGLPYHIRIKNFDIQLSGVFTDSFWDESYDDKFKVIPGVFDINKNEYSQLNFFYVMKKDFYDTHQVIRGGKALFDLSFNVPYDYNIKLEFVSKTMNEISDMHLKRVVKSQQLSSSFRAFSNLYKKLKGIHDFKV